MTKIIVKNGNWDEAQAKLAPEGVKHAEVQQLLDFLARAERGIIR